MLRRTAEHVTDVLNSQNRVMLEAARFVTPLSTALATAACEVSSATGADRPGWRG